MLTWRIEMAPSRRFNLCIIRPLLRFDLSIRRPFELMLSNETSKEDSWVQSAPPAFPWQAGACRVWASWLFIMLLGWEKEIECLFRGRFATTHGFLSEGPQSSFLWPTALKLRLRADSLSARASLVDRKNM